MHLRVAGFTIQVTSAGQDLNVAPGGAWSRFIVDARPPDVRIEVVTRNLGESGDDGARECLFDSGGPWRLYRHDDGFLFRFFSGASSSPYKTALFNHDFSRGQVCLHRPFFADAPAVDPWNTRSTSCSSSASSVRDAASRSTDAASSRAPGILVRRPIGRWKIDDGAAVAGRA